MSREGGPGPQKSNEGRIWRTILAGVGSSPDEATVLGDLLWLNPPLEIVRSEELLREMAGGVVNLDPSALDRAVRNVDGFMRATNPGYVVMNRDRVSSELREFAIRLLGLTKIDDADGYELYVPASIDRRGVPRLK